MSQLYRSLTLLWQNEDLDLEDNEENQQLESSLHDLSIDGKKEELNQIPSREYDILVRCLLQNDVLLDDLITRGLVFTSTKRHSSRYASHSQSRKTTHEAYSSWC